MNGHVVEQLSAFLDGELPEPERTAVAQHLDACAQCTAHLDELAAVDRLAASVTVDAPEGYFDGFASRVRDRVRKPRRRSFAAPMWALTAAATLLLAATVPMLLRRQIAQVAPRDEPAAVENRAPAQTLSPAPSALPQEAQDRLGELGYVEGKLESKRDDKPVDRTAEKAPARTPASRPEPKDEALNAPPPAPAAVPAAPPPAVPAPTPQAKSRSQFESDDRARTAGVEEREQRLETRTFQQPESAAGFASAPESAALESREVPKAALQKTMPSAAFRALLERRAATIAEARGLREAWRAFAPGAPEGEADEARVRVIESGLEAFRLSAERVDLDQLRRDAAAYLKRADAHQAERVRALLRGLPR